MGPRRFFEGRCHERQEGRAHALVEHGVRETQLQRTFVRVHVPEPEAQKMVVDTVDPLLALVGSGLSRRHLTRYQAHLLEHVQVARDRRRLSDACPLHDLVQPRPPLSHCTEHGEVVPRLAQLLHHQEPRLVVKDSSDVEDQRPDGRQKISGVLEYAQVVRKAAEDRPCFQSTLGRPPREELSGCCQVQRRRSNPPVRRP